jgi:5-methylcytosine-specific restriction endonuclease McrA
VPNRPKSFNWRQQEARKKQYQEAYDRKRPGGWARGYDAEWIAYAKAFLARHVWCAYCAERGIETPATVVDHIKPLRWFKELKMDPTNHKPACKSCNKRKSIEDARKYGAK